jgi:HEAT repeat protein
MAEALERLRTAAPEDLVALDESVRSYAGLGLQWNTTAARDVTRADPALIPLLSMHGNGFVREEALHQLATVHDGSELPFLLLRLNDWVAPIRSFVRHAVLARTVQAYIPHFIRDLALVARLERAGRADHRAVIESVRGLLLGAAAREPMLRALADRSRLRRRAVLRILAGAPDGGAEIALAALRSDDPSVRRWSLRTAPPEARREVIEALANDPVGAIRAEALAALDPAEARERWIDALMDRSGAVRDAARFHLRAEGLDFAQRYREALATEDLGRLFGAIEGLGETGDAGDADRVAPLLDHPAPRVRRAAVKALFRLGGDAYVDTLVDRLRDPGPGVSAQVRRGLRRHASALTGQQLWSIFGASRDAHVRRNALSVLAALPKWEAIGYLLSALADADEALRLLALRHVERWNARYNMSHATPQPEQLARAEVALPNVAEPLAGEIRFVIESFRSP